MMSDAKTALIGALLVALVVTAAVIAGLKRPLTPADVSFISLKGEQTALSTLRGKVVLVNFWATTCAICLREMPKIAETHEKYRARGLETIAVAMDYDRPDWVFAYAERTKPPFAIALDLLGTAARAFGGVRGTPTSFLVDKKGRIVWRVEGEPDFADLGRRIERELAEG
jgi:thiol-disulfide isomerase/thioredoxin